MSKVGREGGRKENAKGKDDAEAGAVVVIENVVGNGYRSDSNKEAAVVVRKRKAGKSKEGETKYIYICIYI